MLLAAMAAALVMLIGYLLEAKPASSFSEAVQERVEAGKLPTEKQVRGIGLHHAAVSNAIKLIVLFVTCWVVESSAARFEYRTAENFQLRACRRTQSATSPVQPVLRRIARHSRSEWHSALESRQRQHVVG